LEKIPARSIRQQYFRHFFSGDFGIAIIRAILDFSDEHRTAKSREIVESLMLEEITEKHKTAMLWVHGKHLLAHREENCWRMDAAETDVLFA
jgi:hypothetical protein